MAFTLACAQFAPRKARLDENLDAIADRIRQASAEGAEIVAFPETATSGYFVEGGVSECSLSVDELATRLGSRLDGLKTRVDAVIGFYERSGGNLYNSAAYLSWNGTACEKVHVYRKFFLPTYGVFDEERFVSRGLELGVFDTRLGRIAILICEDVWHSILPTLCAVSGAQLLIVPSASPGRGFQGETVGNLERYGRMLRSVSEEHGMFCANVQLCGFEGGKGFVGGSRVLDPMGRTIAESPILDDHILLAQVDFGLVEVARANLPLVSDLQSAWSDLTRLASNVPRSG